MEDSNNQPQNIDASTLKEALFLFNAVNDGWTVWKNSQGSYEMVKEKKDHVNILK